MSFVSPFWLFWMWATVSLYWLMPRQARPWFLMAVSLLFMAIVDLLSVGLLVGAWAMTVVGIRQKRLTLAMMVGSS